MFAARQLFQLLKKSKLSRRRTRDSHPGVTIAAEVMCERQLLSNVAVTAVAGNLTLTGDGGIHSVLVQASGSNVELQGSSGTQFTYNGATSTVVDIPFSKLGKFNLIYNGGASPDSFALHGGGLPTMNSLSLNLGGANNAATLSAASFTNGINFAGGDQGNNLQIDSISAGSLTASSGAGKDLYLLNNLTLTGSLSINSDASVGWGDDDVTMLGDSIGGTTTLLLGSGTNLVSVDGGHLVGTFFVSSSNAASQFFSVGIDSTTQNAVFDSAISIYGGAGNGSLTINAKTGNHVTISSSLIASMGGISNTVALKAENGGVISISGILTDLGGAGADDLELLSDVPSQLKVGGLSVSLGDGLNKIRLVSANVSGGCTFATGSAIDVVDIQNSVLKSSLNISTGAGPDVVSVIASTISGSVAVNTGSSLHDKVDFEGDEFDQSVTVTMLGGAAEFDVDFSNVNTTGSVVNGALVVIAPGGHDFITLGHGWPYSPVAMFNSLVQIIGGGVPPTSFYLHENSTQFDPNKLIYSGVTLFKLP